jgi:predicted GIY-YIG superfamily endonuclease
MHIVYLATNLVNGKTYIGVTSRPLAVRAAHHARAKDRRTPVWHAIRKYGRDMIRFRVVKVCDSRDDAFAEEIRLIALWKPEYNRTAGGEGSPGHILSAEARKKIGDAHRGQSNPDTMRAMRSPEAIAKAKATRLANGTVPRHWLGKKRDPEMVRASAEKQRKNGHYDRLRALYAKPVRCLNDGVVHASLGDAARCYCVSKRRVLAVCNGQTLAVKGFHFEYVGAADEQIVLSPERRAAWLTQQAEIRDRANDKNRRPVICLTDGAVYPSVSAAADFYGCDKATLGALCLGKRGRKSLRGRRFAFVDTMAEAA